jgi:hypothetical protein
MQPAEFIEDEPAGEDDSGFLGKTGKGKEEQREDKEQDGHPLGGTTGVVITQEAPNAGPGGEKVGTSEKGGHGLSMNGVNGEKEARPKCRTDSGKYAEGQEENPHANESMKKEVREMEAQGVRPPKAVVQGEGKGHQGALLEEPFAGKEP